MCEARRDGLGKLLACRSPTTPPPWCHRSVLPRTAHTRTRPAAFARAHRGQVPLPGLAHARATVLEASPRGLWRPPAKRVGGDTPSRVQIPPPPRCDVVMTSRDDRTQHIVGSVVLFLFTVASARLVHAAIYPIGLALSCWEC